MKVILEKLAILFSCTDFNRLMIKNSLNKGDKDETNRILEDMLRDTRKMIKVIEELKNEINEKGSIINHDWINDVSYTLYDSSCNYLSPSSNKHKVCGT